MTALLTGALATGAVLLLLPDAPARPPSSTTWRSAPASLRGAGQRWADRHLPARRARRRDRQLPDALDRVAAALRAGDSLGVALRTVATATEGPLGVELQAVARAVTLGTPVADSLRAWAGGQSASPDVRLVATALALGARAGGELARAADAVAATVRERHELRREVHALATQARASAGVLAIAPLAFAALVASIEPRAALFLLAEPVGLVCLGAGVVLQVAGVVWMARITRDAT